ncbi:hypothetical protein [Halalkalibacter sp. APA_J-10(15)]|uniref:hypothetical protein n=1 Tax=Halalkalibacter sp. APA_J-10(15) TaxID=2933805 RepID=UPI001FF68B0C|nr:hypothetical protein [Halalkalibacter sp. APA_J-10(15)]MCK0472706.1 hypothetical protein [Halalkalibacter sp. APA_J-10(15)]
MKKGRVCLYLLISLVLFGCQTNSMEEEVIIKQFDQFFEQIRVLFSYHSKEDGVFLNENFHTENDINEVLEPLMTDEGKNQLLGELYEFKDGKYVYNDELQEYLNERTQAEYYPTLRSTVFNPGIRMILEEDLNISIEGNKARVIAENAPVLYFDENSPYGQHHFGMLGYPAIDYLTVHVDMEREGEEYFISSFSIEASSLLN